MSDRLYRHPTDRVISGVAGGLAAWLTIDPSLVRVAWVLLAIFSGGLFVLVYIVMVFVVPSPPPGWIPQPRGYPGSGAAGQGGPQWPQGAAGGWPAQPGGPTQPDGWPNQPDGWPPAQPGPASQPSWTAPRPGNAGLVAGVVLVVLGLWFLVARYVRIDWDLVWPVVIMVAGGALIAAALIRGRSG